MFLLNRSLKQTTAVFPALLLLAGCQSFGPSRGTIMAAPRAVAAQGAEAVEVVNMGPATVTRMKSPAPWPRFADVLNGVRPVGTTVGVGDAMEVTIWEAPPATLFGPPIADTRISAPIATARPTSLPELLVGPEGTISVPFAGAVPAAGHTLREIEKEIVRRLHGKANAPQALARLVRNSTANVTVIGEVNQSSRQPLSPRGERVLDVLAQSGGVKSPVTLTTIQVTRGGSTYRMALNDIIEHSENNVVLARDDVVMALFQPYSFTVLGASGRNEEIKFEALGITLSQALGRIGGLQDGRADPRGIFLFRWEEPLQPMGLRRPVIYNFNLNDPAVFFLAQQVKVRDKDLIYITNSPVAELQRFVTIIASTVLPLATAKTLVP